MSYDTFYSEASTKNANSISNSCCTDYQELNHREPGSIFCIKVANALWSRTTWSTSINSSKLSSILIPWSSKVLWRRRIARTCKTAWGTLATALVWESSLLLISRSSSLAASSTISILASVLRNLRRWSSSRRGLIWWWSYAW
jgi:hypothetical protein